MTDLLVSFVVPTVNRPEALSRFLDSVAAQSRSGCEVIIVDQGGEAAACASRRDVEVIYIRSQRRGLSHNRNVGLGVARGRSVVFADDDCVLSPGYLEGLGRGLPALEGGSAFGYGEARTIEDDQPFVPTFRVRQRPVGPWHFDTLCSISLVFPREVLSRAGGFDERFGVGARFPAGEETDLLLRLAATGVRGRYLPGVVVRHPRRARTPDLTGRYGSFGYGHGALARKHVRNAAYLARFLYGLARSAAGAAAGPVAARETVPLYRASLRGKIAGFLDYPGSEPHA